MQSEGESAPTGIGEELSSGDDRESSVRVRMTLSEFDLPPIQDAAVIGKDAAIDGASLLRCLGSLTVRGYERVTIEDDVIGDIIVRAEILKRVPRERLIRLIVQHVKPMMGRREVMKMTIATEIFIEISR